MGAFESVVQPPCAHFVDWNAEHFKQLRRAIANHHFFFGLSVDNLETLLDGDRVLAERLMSRFNPLWDPAVAFEGAEQPVVNSLSLMSMVCVVATSNDDWTVEHCASALFELFNWDSSRMSVDHLAVAVLSVLRGVDVLTNFPARHNAESASDATAEAIAEQMFELVGKAPTRGKDVRMSTVMNSLDREEFAFAVCCVALGARTRDEAQDFLDWRGRRCQDVELDSVIHNFRVLAAR